MAMKKTVPLTKAGIKKIPDTKAGVYEIKNKKGKSEYVGMAKAGRLQDRVKEHLPSSPKDPIKGGKTVETKQQPNKAAALKTEKKMIKTKQPRQNIKGK